MEQMNRVGAPEKIGPIYMAVMKLIPAGSTILIWATLGK